MLWGLVAICAIVTVARFLRARGMLRRWGVQDWLTGGDPLLSAAARARAVNHPTTPAFDDALSRAARMVGELRRVYDASFAYEADPARARARIDYMIRLKTGINAALMDARFFAGNGDVSSIDALDVLVHRMVASHLSDLVRRSRLDGYAPLPLDDALLGDLLPANIASNAVGP